MKRSTLRIRTTNTGSLPRPENLLALMTAKESGEPTDAEALTSSIRSAVAAAIQLQAEAGVDVLNDGENEQARILADPLGMPTA